MNVVRYSQYSGHVVQALRHWNARRTIKMCIICRSTPTPRRNFIHNKTFKKMQNQKTETCLLQINLTQELDPRDLDTCKTTIVKPGRSIF